MTAASNTTELTHETAETTAASTPERDLWSDASALQAGRHGDPFSVLGLHDVDGTTRVRAFLPGARRVRVALPDGAAAPVDLHQWHETGLWSGAWPHGGDYRLHITWADGLVQETADPYSYGSLLGDLDLHLIGEGRHRELARCLGAQVLTIAGVKGVRFAVWAPNARRVSVVGDWNAWNGLRHPMRLRPSPGVWELFVPGAAVGDRYKYELIGVDGNLLPQRADPMALATEMPPATGSVVADPTPLRWTDATWLERRAHTDHAAAPMSIYEVQAASWLADVNAIASDGEPNGWRLLADKLIPYARGLGFTHIELLPIMEHPFGGSWGYQPLGMFAPSARFGPPSEFATFVDRCHAAGLGVLLDWVPAHFPSDAHGLAMFDGTALYEYADPREGFHQDWNTVIYNLGRHEVRGFMVASALHWIEHYHVDGLRVDAVASMLYRDYSRKAGEWLPNRYGGRENLETVDFLREFNTVVHDRCPGALTIAEESTAWPGVTAPVAQGGLGFDFKWNMGWMHDTLSYVEEQPIYRAWHHHLMTFSLVYAYSEKYVLPISHDEVVHGKGSLIGKMPGDDWQRFANLRAYLAGMWAHPGKKLLFMGCEIAQVREWNHDTEIDWWLLDQPPHAGVQALVRDLNGLHATLPALHALDSDPAGFSWVIGDDNGNSVFAFLRRADDAKDDVLVVLNMTPVVRHGYRIGVSGGGLWHERLNSDAAVYGGSNVGNFGGVEAQDIAAHGLSHSLLLTLPPLAAVFLQR